jgi:toxin YoeB
VRIIFSESAREDYIYWQSNDRKVLKRVNELIKNICREPLEGLGNPEQLRHELCGYWSRRIDREHRLVYKIDADTVILVQCRYHYDGK